MGQDAGVAHPSTRGRLLVATPPLVDPNFDRTVVYMIEHNSDGALGVVLNRPIVEVDFPAEGLRDWADHVAAPAHLFAGGPVSLDAIIALGRRTGRSHPSDTEAGWADVTPGVGTVDLTRPPEEFTPSIDEVRVFAGYSGWAPGQLDAELDAHAWIVIESCPDDVFTDEPDALWRTVLRRQGGRLAWLADAPEDLSAN